MTAEPEFVLESATPILAVGDLQAALDYYHDVLGFGIGWKWGEPPRLASVCRDHVELNLEQSRERSPSVSKVYFRTTGVVAYYSQIVTAGAQVTVPLADRAYGMKDFRVVDPNGNELSFGEPIDS